MTQKTSARQVLRADRRHSRIASFPPFLLLMGLLVFPTLAHACSISWTGGAGDGQWTTAANWDLNRVPNTSDDVCIISGMNVTLSGFGATINSLTNAGTLFLATAPGYGLGLQGPSALSSNQGIIDIQADSSIGGPGTLSNSGTLQKSAGTGVSNISAAVNNAGSIVAQSGILALDAGGSSVGSMTANAPGTLAFN